MLQKNILNQLIIKSISFSPDLPDDIKQKFLADDPLKPKRKASEHSFIGRPYADAGRTSADDRDNMRKVLAKLIENEEAGSGSVGFKQYLQYFKHVGLWMTIFTFATNIAFQTAAVGSNGMLSLRLRF